MAMTATKTLRTVLDPSGSRRLLEIPTLRLSVETGPALGARFVTDQRVVRIGGGSAADFRIADPTVSAIHCELRADEEGIRVIDLDAKNGTRIGRRRVKDAWVDDEEALLLGDCRLRIHFDTDPIERELDDRVSFGRLQGSSWRMRELYGQLERAAATDASVHLWGETGTGKELAADAIVNAGQRKRGPLVVLDCTRLTADLADSELFGHEKGAFTGADQLHRGAFERAHGGTLFLDEVGELPMALQPKLLGALERKAFTRVGGTQPIAVDTRIISATHRRLERDVNRGTFRADLYFRLAAVTIALPALRERAEDTLMLVSHFLRDLGATVALAPAVLEQLCARDYPGNVRELRNAVERAALGLDFPKRDKGAGTPSGKVDLSVAFRIHKAQVINDFERAYIGQLLERHQGNITEAAHGAGLNRVHLHEVIRRLGLAGDGS